MIALKNILVATDFAEPSEAALRYGRALARSFDATLHVLHVVDDYFMRVGAGAQWDLIPDLQSHAEAFARTRLGELLLDNDPNPVRVLSALSTSAAPAAAIVQYARDKQVDLIVVGTHGRSGVAHVLMGSVAERVVRTAPCPVLTVRHPEHEFLTSEALVAATRA